METYDIVLSTGETLTIQAPDQESARRKAEEYISGSVSAPQQTVAQPTDVPAQNLTTTEALTQGVLNLPESTYRLGKETVQALLSPIETADTITKLGAGLLQNVLPEKFVQFIGEDAESRELARQVGEYYKNQYGSIDSVKKAFAEDPAFILADISTVFGIGAATLPGRAGAAAARASAVTNPLTQTAIASRKLGRGTNYLASEVLGLTAGTGSLPIKEAFNAALAGGQKGKEFLTQMRKPENVGNLVSAAEASLQDMVRRRNTEYLGSKTRIAMDDTQLDILPIKKKLTEQIKSLVSGEGDVIDPNALKTLNQARDIIDNWGDLTPMGLDGLKRRLYTLADYNQPGTYRVIKNLYDEVKDTIVKQAPEYARLTKNYAEASELIDEIKKTLSINPQATVDTQIRKLLSAMRDNVNASFGRRSELVSELEKASGRQLKAGLAGASLSPLTPRGLARILPAAGGAIALGGGASIPGLIAGLGMTSPRLIGEAAYGAGLLDKAVPQIFRPEVMNALYQAEQAQDIQEDQLN